MRSLVGVVRADDDAWQSEVQQVEGGKHRGLEVFSDGDHGGVEVLNVLGEERFFVRRIKRDGQADVFLEQFGPVGIGVESEHLCAASGKRQCDLGAVATCAKHGKTRTCHGTKDVRKSYSSVTLGPRAGAGRPPTRDQTLPSLRSCCRAARVPFE